MRSNHSLTTRPLLLLESGDVAEGAALGAASGLVLSRALCRFKAFRAAPGLTRDQLRRSARTFAEANAPFADVGWRALRTNQGAAIWYWDQSRLAELGAAGARLTSPESLWRAPSEGWRMIACAEGFEAQLHEAGGLVASTWRREPFSREQWIAFVLSVEAFDTPAPDEPPAPLSLPLEDRSWLTTDLKAPFGWRDVEIGAVSVALCAGALAAFFAGQALRHEGVARAESRQALAIDTRMREDSAIVRARDRAGLIRDYVAVASGAEALDAVADVFSVLGAFQLAPRSWRADREHVEAVIDAPDGGASVREIMLALEAAPHLCGVTPELASQDGVEITATIAGGRDCNATEDRGER